MRSAEIRQRFLDFFEQRGHTVVPSASLLLDDPTLLLVNAGMVPFKPYFLGDEPAPYARATSVQKCVRTPDIDIVGTTTRHNTFFQMAGNFSFGDYFKEGAIPLAWELLTSSVESGGYGFDGDRLWATVYDDDDEAFGIWTSVVGLPAERVQRRGKADNYWHMGVPGPGGPCSEIYFDRGSEHGREGGPVADEERYLEVWNLVFMQVELSAVRSKEDFDIRAELPAKNIDTGMGVERMATLLQGVENVYETDLLRPLLDQAGQISGVRYGDDEQQDVRLRVVADHTRTATMLIGDGVVPSNEARGYVLRRMLRRVIRNLRILGTDRAAIGELVGTACTLMGESYPEVQADSGRIVAIAAQEEDSFLSTLRTGSTRFEQVASTAKQTGSSAVSGEDAFTLHDTYGFPIDLTIEMAREQGLAVDEDEFRRLMQEQRTRAKRDAAERKTGHADVSVYRSLLEAGGPSTFTGYTEIEAEAVLRGLLVDGVPAQSASAGTDVELTLDRTPFYAEAGGQLADHGRITFGDGAVVEVYDAQKPLGDLVVHRGRVVSGELTVGSPVLASVDVMRRKAISRAHTATHLVHTAIRRALGEQAAQAGSLNDAGRFRFDFSSPTALPAGVLGDVEGEVNAVLLDDLPVHAFVTTQDEARRIGAIALFGEKYGASVRVVEVGDYARELCGGTHAARSTQLGLVKLLSESSIGAGVRRIEGLVGADAFTFLAREHLLVSQLTDALRARPEELPERVHALVTRVRELEKDLEKSRAAAVLEQAGALVASATDEFGVAVVTHHAPDGTSADDLRKLALDVRGRLGNERPAAVAVAAVNDSRPVVVVAVNEIGRSWGLAAGDLVRIAASTLGGGGGGRDDVAQGGGTKPESVEEALTAVRHRVGQRVTGSA
ncbi:MAG TPA: alanine--tRNA ligase [Mycobacteriales bacterium]|nr:alanine--tRNA ligase [Mycobacteriales bacterium]